MSSIPPETIAFAGNENEKDQNSDRIFALISDIRRLYIAGSLRGLAFCIVPKLMPDFALTFRNGAVAMECNVGNKMYQLRLPHRTHVRDPQIELPTHMFMYLVINGEQKIVKLYVSAH